MIQDVAQCFINSSYQKNPLTLGPLYLIFAKIWLKRDAYDEVEDIDVEELIKQAENKFKTLVLEEKWNSKTKEQHQIIFLTAAINKLKDERVRLGLRSASSSNNQSSQSKSNFNSYNKANKKVIKDLKRSGHGRRLHQRMVSHQSRNF